MVNNYTSVNKVNQDIRVVDFAHKTTDLAYKIKDLQKFGVAKDIFKEDLKDTGWEVLYNSSENKGTSKAGYKAVAFVNKTTKEVHIAAAGTVPTDINDLIDDALITVQRVPYKITQAKQMVTEVINLLGKETVGYTFSTSGHSLGAIISDLTAVEIISRGFEFNKSTTFDSPGSLAVVEKALQDNLFTGKVTNSIKELAEHCEIYNAKPNFINGTNHQLGNVHLTLPAKAHVLATEDSATESNGLWGWGTYLCSKVGSAVSAGAGYLGITKVVKQIEDHSLKNFNQLESTAATFLTDNWQKVGGALVIKSSEALKKVTSTGNDILILDQEDRDSAVYINKEEYSYADLHRAGAYKACATEDTSVTLSGIDLDNWVEVY